MQNQLRNTSAYLIRLARLKYALRLAVEFDVRIAGFERFYLTLVGMGLVKIGRIRADDGDDKDSKKV